MTMHRRLATWLGIILALTAAAGPVSAAPPSNDSWQTPAVIDSLPANVTVDLSEATLDGDPQFCGAGTASVWYRYTASNDEIVTVALASEPWMGAIHIAIDDPNAFDSCMFAGWTSRIPLAAGATMYLQVSTDGAPTAFDIDGVTAIPNDRFEGAEVITGFPAVLAPDLTRSTGSGDPSTCSSAANGAWYRLSPASDQGFDITPRPNAVVSLIGASAHDVQACLFPWNGRYRANLAGGATYHLLVQSDTPDPAGTAVTIDVVPPPPTNDDRASAAVIATLPAAITADIRSATPDPDSNRCFDSDWPSVWYRYTPSADAIVDIDVAGGSGQAAALFIYEGDDGERDGCTRFTADGKALVRAGSSIDISLGAPAAADPSVSMTVTSSPAPTIAATVVGGVVERVSGTAIVHGTAICSTAGEAGIFLHLRQRVGRTVLIEGQGGATFACGPTASPWTVRVEGDGGPFGVGGIGVTYDAEFGEWPLSDRDFGTTTVKLRGR